MTRRQINEEELAILYALIGEAIWNLQLVENALSFCITIKRDIKVRGSTPPNEADALLAKHQASTLGTSLRIAREAQIFPNALFERLNQFKEERDWLVHRSVRQNGEDLYLEEKRVAFVARINAFSNEAGALQSAIVTKESVEADAQLKITKLRGI